MNSARRQRLRELIAARNRLDAQIVALGGFSTRPPKAPPRKAADHGTESGYTAHRRQQSGFPKEACAECRRAHAEYNRARAYAKSTDLPTDGDNPPLTRADNGRPCDNKATPGALGTATEGLTEHHHLLTQGGDRL